MISTRQVHDTAVRLFQWVVLAGFAAQSKWCHLVPSEADPDSAHSIPSNRDMAERARNLPSIEECLEDTCDNPAVML